MAAPDPQDPLPELSFRWRRLLTFAITVGLMALLWAALNRLLVDDVLAFAQGLMLLMALVWLLYFGGASAGDITALISTLRLRLGRRSDPPPDA